jgi:hypothetical protein
MSEDELIISGILGVYFLAAPLGSLVDKYGPRMRASRPLSFYGQADDQGELGSCAT